MARPVRPRHSRATLALLRDYRQRRELTLHQRVKRFRFWLDSDPRPRPVASGDDGDIQLLPWLLGQDVEAVFRGVQRTHRAELSAFVPRYLERAERHGEFFRKPLTSWVQAAFGPMFHGPLAALAVRVADAARVVGITVPDALAAPVPPRLRGGARLTLRLLRNPGVWAPEHGAGRQGEPPLAPGRPAARPSDGGSAAPVARLVYAFAANGGLSITTKDQAEHDHAVRRALRKARTWGQLRSLLPDGEWDTIEDALNRGAACGLCDDDENEPDTDHAFWEDDARPFDAGQIPGYADGDYPAWRQQELDQVIPGDLLRRFGQRETSIHNGPFWLIPHGAADELLAALRERGYHAEEARSPREW